MIKGVYEIVWLIFALLYDRALLDDEFVDRLYWRLSPSSLTFPFFLHLRRSI